MVRMAWMTRACVRAHVRGLCLRLNEVLATPFSTAFPIYDDKAVEIGLRTFYELENWQTCVLFLHFFLCSYCDFAEILRRTSVYRYNSLETIYGMNVQNLDLLI